MGGANRFVRSGQFGVGRPVGRASTPAAGLPGPPNGGVWHEKRVLEDPRTVETPAQPVGEQAGLETRRRRGRPPHMVFITIRGPQAHPDRHGGPPHQMAKVQRRAMRALPALRVCVHYPPIAYIGRGGATKREVLISCPSHLPATLRRIRAAISSSDAPPRSIPLTSSSSMANRQ